MLFLISQNLSLHSEVLQCACVLLGCYLKLKELNTYIEYTNVSVYNTTIYFIYIKWYIDRATCFDLHWVILKPSKKADPRLHIYFTETHCGIPNAVSVWDPLLHLVVILFPHINEDARSKSLQIPVRKLSELPYSIVNDLGCIKLQKLSVLRTLKTEESKPEN
jgi:hypothetical protein